MSARNAWGDLLNGPTLATVTAESFFKCGHPRSVENTHIYQYRQWVYRKCRVCHNANGARYRRGQGLTERRAT